MSADYARRPASTPASAAAALPAVRDADGPAAEPCLRE